MISNRVLIAIVAVATALATTMAATQIQLPLFQQEAVAQNANTTTTTNQTAGNQTGVNMTTTTGGGGGDQETANKQLDQAIKALESGDNAAAEGWMKEADKTLPEGEAKMHLGEAMKALQAGNIEGAMMHTQAAQGSLPVNIS